MCLHISAHIPPVGENIEHQEGNTGAQHGQAGGRANGRKDAEAERDGQRSTAKRRS